MIEVFPPALVPVLRDRHAARGSLGEVPEELLEELLTTVFFAGLETHESERHPIRVVFVGRGPVELVVPEEGAAPGAGPGYRWKILGFEAARPFSIAELGKLAVASVDGRIFTAVQVDAEGRLAITGLASEGLNAEDDPFVKVIAARPGSLSIRSGRERLLEYERGLILAGGEEVVNAARPVRRALERVARMAGLEDEELDDYVGAVRALVREMSAHGRGGILVIHPEERPAEILASAPYRMILDSSLASLLRLARRIGRGDGPPSSRPSLRYFRGHGEGDDSERVSFRTVLRNAFLSEAERVIEELGALTGIDGATVLNRNLALVAFGVILPLGDDMIVADATAGAEVRLGVVELTSRGTRHRAAASYAALHPGCIVFVASEDGHVTCMFREPAKECVVLWHLGSVDVQVA